MSKVALKRNGDFKDVSHKQSNEKETYVIIIGESTTRTHLGLYGYYRNTTPLLKEKSDELLIYDNVQAPHTLTISSLGKTLTIDEHSNPLK